ncbi:O-antigen ligase domain-containing protein [uncultured Thiomicrorhabdus sp.]
MNGTLRLLLFIGLILTPFYVFKSGLPQPADFILIFFSLLAYVHALGKFGMLPAKLMPLSWTLMLFWVIFIILLWSLIMFSGNFFKDALFWIYNYLIASSILYVIAARIVSIESLHKAIQIALIISGIGAILSIGISVRPTGFFNNPNQLAFYSLCGLAINQALSRGYISFSPLSFAAFIGGTVGIFAAASMAAMAGFVMLILAHFIASRNFSLMIKSFFGIAILSTVLFTVNIPFLSDIVSNVQYRFEHAERMNKFGGMSEERNYDRILAFPEYTLIGAGEAHLERFYPHDNLEIHSSFGNMLFAYGIVGFALFMTLLYRATIRAPFAVWFVMAAPMLYSITHMGLRTTMFWIFILLVWAYYNMDVDKNAR